MRTRKTSQLKPPDSSATTAGGNPSQKSTASVRTTRTPKSIAKSSPGTPTTAASSAAAVTPDPKPETKDAEDAAVQSLEEQKQEVSPADEKTLEASTVVTKSPEVSVKKTVVKKLGSSDRTESPASKPAVTVLGTVDTSNASAVADKSTAAVLQAAAKAKEKMMEESLVVRPQAGSSEISNSEEDKKEETKKAAADKDDGEEVDGSKEHAKEAAQKEDTEVDVEEEGLAEGTKGEGGGREECNMLEETEEEGEGMAADEQIEISDMVEERKMKKEQEIFVGGLDRDATEEDLKNVFSNVGDVIEVRLHKDLVTSKNKGYAFVKFASKDQVTRAVTEMKNPVIRGKRCGIARSEDNDTLFLGNICNTWTREAIKNKLKEYGVDGVENITLVEDTQNEGLSRGFAFVEFTCHDHAMHAYKRLQKPDVIFGHPDRTAKVAFAEPLREPDADVMAQVKSVFVDGLPPVWDEDHVKEQFKGYGEIQRVVLARNMPSAKRVDFGFVNFTTHESAVACVEAVNNSGLGDGKSKMKARARLANPLPKTQAVKGGMHGGFRIGFSTGGYSRFGRGLSRGRSSFQRAAFQGGRGFIQHGRGRGGRFPFAGDAMDTSYSDFRGRHSFGVRGGRRGSFRGRGAFASPVDEFSHQGRAFPPRGPPFPADADFGEPFRPRYFGDDPYLYSEGRPGIKRPFSSMMEQDLSVFEPRSRLRPRYDYSDPMFSGAPYRDSLGGSNSLSREYYEQDYGGSSSSVYRGERSGGGYYY